MLCPWNCWRAMGIMGMCCVLSHPTHWPHPEQTGPRTQVRWARCRRCREEPGGELEQDVTFILLVSLSTMPVLKAVLGCMFLAAPLWTNWGAWIPSRHCASYQQQTYVPEECRLEANVPSLVFAFSSFLSSTDLSLWGQPALISALLASSQGFAIYLKHFSGSQKGQIKKEKKCGFAMCLNSSIVANCY